MPKKKDPQSDAIAPVYVVFGQEEFLKSLAITEILDRAVGDADRSMCISEADSATADLADVLDELRTLPFLSERRIVVVRDADSFISRYRPKLEEYLDNPSPTGVLLMECRSFPGNTKLHKKAAAVGQVHKCDTLYARQVPAWLTERATRAHGLKLDARTAGMLTDFVGTDLGQLDSELQKLSLYVGERKRIEPADIEALVGHNKEEKVWTLLAMIGAGNLAGAMKLWEEVLQSDKDAPFKAIGGITFTVRKLLEAKQGNRTAGPPPSHAELNAFSTEQLEEMLCILSEADVAGKTGQAGVQSRIERFIVQLSSNRRSRATG